MAEHQVLFCPFCRDSFEGAARCPAHDLPLVPLEKLPRAPELEADDDPDERRDAGLGVAADLHPISAFDPRYGRAPVALGALLIGAALPLGLVRFEVGPPLRTYELARALPSLWTLALIAFTVFYTLARRRTLRALRGLRVLIPLLGLLPIATLAWAVFRRLGLGVSFGPAAYAIAAGSLLLVIGGLRLGRE